jgi:acyl-CoA synthetase (AMP-forming)/AMP-acid ligase II
MDDTQHNCGYFPREIARRFPDRVALIDYHDGAERQRTFGSLEDRLDRIASALTEAGLKSGDRVALLVGNRIEYVEALFGCMRAGLVPLTVNTKLGKDGIIETLRLSNAQAAIVDPNCGPGVAEAAAVCGVVVGIGANNSEWLDYETAIETASPYFKPPKLEPNATAMIFFTSGSTGKPKGVVFSHRAQRRLQEINGRWQAEQVGGTVRCIIYLPIFHVNGLYSSSLALFTGGSAVILPSFEPAELLRMLERHRINYFSGIAVVYSMLLKEQKLMSELDFSSIKYLHFGAAPAAGELMRKAQDAMRVRAVQVYGSTEAGRVLGAQFDDYPLQSSGYPVTGNELKLIDPATGSTGEKGELWIRNEWLADGYLNDPQATAEKFVDGWYRTGDIFERDPKGYFYFVGRTDEMFNVGGDKVYPAEVESTLLKHPEVLGACVASAPHPVKGVVPVAMVVRQTSSDLTEGELAKFCRENGPVYAFPRVIHFVEALPMTTMGKPDRTAVRRALLPIAHQQLS